MNNPFKNILKGRVVIVGIGNVMKADDGFGPALIERLSARLKKSICIDAGTTPENCIGKILKENPDVILLVDAAHINLEPGRYKILEKDEILKSGLTTHDISPKMFIEYLEDQTKAPIYLLAVQPKDLSLANTMSKGVKDALSEIAGMLLEIDHA